MEVVVGVVEFDFGQGCVLEIYLFDVFGLMVAFDMIY